MTFENFEKPEGSSQKPEELAVAVAQDAELSRVFRGSVGRDLDAQRGRARAAFARAIQNPEFNIPNDAVAGRITPDTEHAREVRRLKFWAGAASALAASLAIVIGVQTLTKPGTHTNVRTNGGHASTPVMDHVEFSRDVDGGTVVFDQMPLRVVRQQTVKRTQWFDPQENATYSVIEPVERVGYQRLMPY
jgi:hypothetical protein